MDDREDMYEIEDQNDFLYNEENDYINQEEEIGENEENDDYENQNQSERIDRQQVKEIQSDDEKRNEENEEVKENKERINELNQSNIGSNVKSKQITSVPVSEKKNNKQNQNQTQKQNEKQKQTKSKQEPTKKVNPKNEKKIKTNNSNLKSTVSFNQLISKGNSSLLKSPIKNNENEEKPDVASFCYYDPFRKEEFENDFLTKGERIYMKNLAERYLKLINEDQERKVKEKTEEKNTFKPNLQITSYYKPSKYSKTNYLNETTCFKNKQIEESRESTYNNDELEDKIEFYKQKRIVLSPEKLEAHVERLYKENEKKKMNIEKLKEEVYSEIYTYKPEINHSSDVKLNFYERLNEWLASKKIKDEERRRITGLDSKTERKLFSPDLSLTKNKNKKFEITQSQAFSQRESMTISDYLHKEKKEIFKKKEELLKEAYEKMKVDSERTVTSPKSRELNEKNKSDLFKKIFEILDDNQDGIISHEDDFNHAMKEVPLNVVNILKPLFEEFKENKEVLKLDEFVVSCGRLYNILDYHDKSMLFQYIFQVKRLQSPRTVIQNNEKENERKVFSHQPILGDNTYKVFDSSEKYSGTNFLERNYLYVENRKKVIEQGINKQLAREKEGKSINIIITIYKYIQYIQLYYISLSIYSTTQI